MNGNYKQIIIIMKEKYNPKNIEEPIYNFWEELGCFKINVTNNCARNYCVVMPPPNITGGLHLGHAFQQIIMDILVRYYRMQGYNTLWITGLDHAGIATQFLVENNIYKKTGKTRKDYSIEFLLRQIWLWKERSEKLINYQMKRLGNSVDWDRRRFTMDSKMSFSVKEAFIRLYKKNFIYRGKRLVNWDFSLQTAISDLEVSHKQMQGSMWYLRYKLEDKVHDDNINNYLVVATTRPETILGDVAVAVHPQDFRYNKLINKYVLIPFINRRIPIISDTSVDMNKGTGCVKITPAHDFNDYVMAKKYQLPMINIFSLDRKILERVELFNNRGMIIDPSYYHVPKLLHNLDCNQAREFIIAACDNLGLLADKKTYDLTIPFNSRTGTIIEPMLTDQWYIRMKDLSEQAICAVQSNKIEFIPNKYKNMFFKWMENIQDWCISRQIYWGHEIPAWYDDNANLVYVGHCENSVRIDNKLSNDVVLRKDTDVLDTWFSSSLWTFASLGWPKSNMLLNLFHPTNIMVSGFDIIFFWIARMIMMTMCFTQDQYGNVQIPFKRVYITGLVRDEFGQKMSKSKGNVIDPLDMIDGILMKDLLKKRVKGVSDLKFIDRITASVKKQFPDGIQPYGSDALRLTLSALSSSGRDIYWDMNRLNGYYGFCNKLWNVSKFIFIHTLNQDCGFSLKENVLYSSLDKWIITKLNQTIQNFHKALENYRFDRIVSILYEFVWHQFCDWYIEFSKSILYTSKDILELRSTRYTLITSLEVILRLAHPVIPFITEKIWQTVKNIIKIDGSTIMLQSFPTYNSDVIDFNSVADLEWIKTVISEIRMLRSYIRVLHKIPLKVAFKNFSEDTKRRILENRHILTRIANIENIDFFESHEMCDKSFTIVLDKVELLIFIPETFNKQIAIDRFNKEINLINNKISFIRQKINNNNLNCVSNSFLEKDIEKLNHFNDIKNKLVNYCAVIKSL